MICDNCQRRDADNHMMCPVAGAVSQYADKCRHHRPCPVLFGGDISIPGGQCPECGGQLHTEIYEWDTVSGRPTIGGYTVDCVNDDNANHRYWQSDWQPVIDRVGIWLGAE